LFKDVQSPEKLDEDDYADLMQQIDKKSQEISVDMIAANQKKSESNEDDNFGTSEKRGSSKTRPSTSHTLRTNKRISSTTLTKRRKMN